MDVAGIEQACERLYTAQVRTVSCATARKLRERSAQLAYWNSKRRETDIRGQRSLFFLQRALTLPLKKKDVAEDIDDDDVRRRLFLHLSSLISHSISTPLYRYVRAHTSSKHSHTKNNRMPPSAPLPRRLSPRSATASQASGRARCAINLKREGSEGRLLAPCPDGLFSIEQREGLAIKATVL